MSRILVTDGDERAALALVRSLGAGGDEVFVCSPRGRSLAGASRYAREEAEVPGSASDGDTYVERIAALARRWRLDMVLPVSEASLRKILPRTHRLPGVRIPFPDAGIFHRVSDKAWLMQTATRIGVPVPGQVTIAGIAASRSALRRVAALRFPVVLKPSRSFVRGPSGGESPPVRYAATPAELSEVIDAYPRHAYPLLVQERIVGPGMGVFMLVWEGSVRAVFSHRRVREKPPSGGVSVCRESVPADPRLVDMALALLQEVGWEGVAMVEFKVDQASGTPYLMEINGRFWGSLQLAVDAGVDFPRLLVDAASGNGRPTGAAAAAGEASPEAAVVSRPEAATGNGYVRSRWFWGEVDHLLARLKGGSGTRAGEDPPRGDRLRALAEVLQWRAGDREEVLRRDDPGPFLFESRRWFRQALQSCKKRGKS